MVKEDIDDLEIDDNLEEDSSQEDAEDQDDLGIDDEFEDEYGYDSVPPMTKHSDLLKELTNFAPYLKDTVNGWLGLTWDELQGKYVPNPYIKPIMNRHCAAWCVSLLRTYARGNNIITDINGVDYKYMMQDIIDNVWLNIGTRADTDFGINDDGDILRVCNEMEHAAELVLMGAGEGRYNKFLQGTMQTNYNGSAMQGQPGVNIQNYSQQPKPGMVGRMKNILFGTGNSGQT